MIAGERDGWDYVWPRDASAGAIALEAAGLRPEARRVVGFLSSLDLEEAARFYPEGSRVPGRTAAGDEEGWVATAESVRKRTVRSIADRSRARAGQSRRVAGIARTTARTSPGTCSGTRSPLAPRQPRSGIDFSPRVAWSARRARVNWTHPRHGRSPSFPSRGCGRRLAARSLISSGSPRPSASRRSRVGRRDRSGPRRPPGRPGRWRSSVTPERRIGLLRELRRAATPYGTLPERVNAIDGRPTSTTPLAWSHAFAILALRARYPQ